MVFLLNWVIFRFQLFIFRGVQVGTPRPEKEKRAVPIHPRPAASIAFPTQGLKGGTVIRHSWMRMFKLVRFFWKSKKDIPGGVSVIFVFFILRLKYDGVLFNKGHEKPSQKGHLLQNCQEGHLCVLFFLMFLYTCSIKMCSSILLAKLEHRRTS